MHGMIRIRIGLPSRQFALRSLPNPKIPLTLKILPILRPHHGLPALEEIWSQANDAPGGEVMG